jgi:hypothetical protein
MRPIRFLICVDISEGDVRATLPKFPSLLAAIVLDRQVDGMSDHPCDIYIHKPVRARTLFHDILRTPVHHVSRDHRKCTAPHKKEERYNFLCLKEEAKPRVRPCAIIQRVFLDADACLLPHPTADDWTTEIRLSNTAFIPRLNANKGSKAILNTLFEILRLAGRQADPAFLRELEEMQIRDLDWPMTACRHRAVYTPHHIRFEVTKKGWDQFEKRVRPAPIVVSEIELIAWYRTVRLGGYHASGDTPQSDPHHPPRRHAVQRPQTDAQHFQDHILPPRNLLQAPSPWDRLAARTCHLGAQHRHIRCIANNP